MVGIIFVATGLIGLAVLFPPIILLYLIFIGMALLDY